VTQCLFRLPPLRCVAGALQANLLTYVEKKLKSRTSNKRIESPRSRARRGMHPLLDRPEVLLMRGMGTPPAPWVMNESGVSSSQFIAEDQSAETAVWAVQKPQRCTQRDCILDKSGRGLTKAPGGPCPDRKR
jgi:hypothetical protein